jgi:glutaredoxin-like YruB-family protein
MRAIQKCLALSALFLAMTNCSAMIGNEKIQHSPPPPESAAASYPRIVIYTVSWCPHCKEAKEYLSDRKIPFINLDVEEDENARDVLQNKYQATSVPLIVIGNDKVILKGFKRESLEKALDELNK